MHVDAIKRLTRMPVVHLANATLVNSILPGNPPLHYFHCLSTLPPAVLLSLGFFMLAINHPNRLPDNYIRRHE